MVSHQKSMKKYREMSSSNLHGGIKALSKHSRQRLDAYQHLFYLLQVQPCQVTTLLYTQ